MTAIETERASAIKKIEYFLSKMKKEKNEFHIESDMFQIFKIAKASHERMHSINSASLRPYGMDWKDGLEKMNGVLK